MSEAPDPGYRYGEPPGPRRHRAVAPHDATTGPVTTQRPGRGRADRLLRRLVGLARVLAGGLVVLAVVVLGAPLVLGGPGPGAATVLAHAVAAVVAVGATALAAHRRTPVPVALVAALVVPVTVLVLFGAVWWS